ncbi:helix-turn-helix domain-containing protein [Epilithonimonas sp. JDS]|uniref:helix-turn-helix domain-containing protein n=1 Tax=Epilithonimonas sp. JDS TaxID=2902797 RepID=UPI001E5BDEB2|nr:helix-turn-helix domain-containing protein [Epilithonimonas sp. JDS]MCD9856269.1 helix-turn-helix domain-containing protein [Epilithonimonas sp. JDS]
MKLFTVILFCLLGTFHYPQKLNKNTDSLVNALDQIKFSDPEKTIKISNDLLKTDLSNKNLAYTNRALGYSYMVKGDMKQMQEYFGKAYDFALKSDDPLCKVKVSCSVAEAYANLKLYKEAENYLSKGLDFSKDLKNTQENLMAITNIYALYGNVYHFTNQDDKAITMHHKNISISEDIKDEAFLYKLKTYSYLGLGNAYLSKKKTDSADLYYKKGLALSLRSPQKNNLYYFYLGLADENYSLKNYPEAISYYKKVLTVEAVPEYLKADAFKKLSDIYLEMNDASQAKVFSDSANISTKKVADDNNNAVQVAVKKIYANSEEKINEQSQRVSLLYKVIYFILSLLALVTVLYFYNLRNQKKRYRNYLNKVSQQTNTQTETILENLSVMPAAINSETEVEILKKLKRFEESESFRDQNMSLSVLSSRLNTNTNYLSRVINNHYGKNFNNYINDLRIDYIIKKIRQDPKYRKYKISALAADCGFASHSSFTTKFKEITGLPPSQFMDFSAKEVL